MTYRRSVLAAARTLEVEAAEMPAEIAPGWVRLRLGAASLCGTDMHYFRHFANAGFALHGPTTLGHEASAWVEDANGADLEPGDLVAISPVIACGDCPRCAVGEINMCAQKRFPGSATTVPHIDGFFRERFDFPAKCLVRVDPTVRPEHLTFAEPLACAMHCASRAEVGPGDKVLVTGCGPMGLLSVIACAARGARVDVTDLRPEPVAAAIKVGARQGYAGADTPPEDAYDVVIEASGSPIAFNVALASVRKQGRLGVLSLIQPQPVPVDLHRIALKEVRVAGSILYTDEFAQAVDLIVSGRADIDAITAGLWPLADIQDACEQMAEGRAVGKVVVIA